jgi:hypothetical protein
VPEFESAYQEKALEVDSDDAASEVLAAFARWTLDRLHRDDQDPSVGRAFAAVEALITDLSRPKRELAISFLDVVAYDPAAVEHMGEEARDFTRAVLSRATPDEGPTPWTETGWTSDDVERFAGGLRGRRLCGVRYRFPVTWEPLEPDQQPGVDDVPMSVDLATDGGDVFRAAWKIGWMKEGLLFGPRELVPISSAPSGPVDVTASPRWSPVVGRRIDAVRHTWFDDGTGRRYVLAVEVGFEGDVSVTLAMGEIQYDPMGLRFSSDNILVLFEPALAREFERFLLDRSGATAIPLGGG